MPFPSSHPRSNPSSNPLSWRLLLVVLLTALFLGGGWLLWRMHSTAQRISLTNSATSPWEALQGITSGETDPERVIASLRQDDQGMINVLLLGIAGEQKPGNLLTDTIIVLRIDTRNHRVGLLSLPRDLLVPLDDSGREAKINSLYPIGSQDNKGVAYTRQAVSLVTGLPIHYFVVMNFDGFQQVIDALGGISVFVERDLLDTRYPGPNYSYETFSITRGWHDLDGATALKYARERHDDPEGDFGRAKRQQAILQTVKDKILSIKTLANPFALNRLLTALGDNVRTDIAPEQIPAFLEIAKTIDTHTLSTAVIDAWKSDSLLKVSHVATDNGAMFALVPRTGNWNETRDLAANLFDLDSLRRHEEAIQTEQPTIAIINRSGHADYGERLRHLLTAQFGFEHVQIIGDSQRTTHNESLVFDHSNGTKPWSLDSLIKKFPLTLAQESISENQNVRNISEPAKQRANAPSANEQQPDLTLVLGTSMQSVFRYDEASREDYQRQTDTLENNF